MFGKNKYEHAGQPQTPGLSVTLPMYRIIRVRLVMLITMFTLGVVTQFLLAIYAPDVWNYMYMVMKNITG